MNLTDSYLTRNNDIPENFNEFLSNYDIPDNEITLFREFAVEKGIEIDNKTSFKEELEKLIKKYDMPEETTDSIEKVVADKGIDLDEALFQKSIGYIKTSNKTRNCAYAMGYRSTL